MLEKRSLGTLKRTNSEDSLNERFKDYIIQGTNYVFLNCDDNKKYINPEYYKLNEVR